MPLSQRILVPYSEYQRLVASEKRLTLLLQHEKSKGSVKNNQELEAANLHGGGAGGSATDLPLAGLIGELPNNLPAVVDTNVLPPRANPILHDMQFPSNSDRIQQEEKRNKDLPPSLPLNDPLGAIDPSLPEGMPPTKSFSAAKNLGHGNSKPVQTQAWYYLGSADSSSEEDDLHLM